MQRGQVRNLFLLEASGLALISSTAGFLAGFLLLVGMTYIDLSSYTPLAIFLSAGRPEYYLNPAIIIINFMIYNSISYGRGMGPGEQCK